MLSIENITTVKVLHIPEFTTIEDITESRRELKDCGFDKIKKNNITHQLNQLLLNINGNKAILRFCNSIESDVQDAELTHNTDSTYSFRTINKNALRRAVNRNILKFQGI